MKLDGDVELPPDYFERPPRAASPRTRRSASPAATSSSRSGAGGVPIPIPPTTSTARSSATRRECFAAIGGMQERLGWDTIDETYARMRGFATRYFPDLVASTTAPWAAPRARCAAAPATARAPTSPTTRCPGCCCAR